MKELYQLKISLKESKPLIWRRVLVNEDTTYFELHHIIQIAMGWQNYHMFEFSIESFRIGFPYEDEITVEYGNDGLVDSRKLKLSDLIPKVGDTINYVYDFGDNWEHSILFEDFVAADPNLLYPFCTDGQMACPPEDSGGLRGHFNNLEILADKKHPEYRDTKTWMPRGYDPNKLDIEKINKQLGKLDKYISKWLTD